MPREVDDITGREFGRLTVIELAKTDAHRNTYWLCRCACGAQATVRRQGLVTGRTVSCGCYRKDPLIRKAARLQVPKKLRKEIAREGAAARWGD